MARLSEGTAPAPTPAPAPAPPTTNTNNTTTTAPTAPSSPPTVTKKQMLAAPTTTTTTPAPAPTTASSNNTSNNTNTTTAAPQAPTNPAPAPAPTTASTNNTSNTNTTTTTAPTTGPQAPTTTTAAPTTAPQAPTTAPQANTAAAPTTTTTAQAPATAPQQTQQQTQQQQPATTTNNNAAAAANTTETTANTTESTAPTTARDNNNNNTTTTTPPPAQQQQQQQAKPVTAESSVAGAAVSGTLPAAPKIDKPKTVAAARTEGAKLLSKSSEIGRSLELEPGYTQGVPAYKKQRENLAAASANTVSTLSNLKAALDTARWQRLQYGNISGTLSSKVTDVRDRVEDEEARVAANPVDKAKNIAVARSQLLRDLAMRREVFTVCAKWARQNTTTSSSTNKTTTSSSEQNQDQEQQQQKEQQQHPIDIRTAELELAIKYAEEWPAFVQKARSTLQTVDSDSHQLHGVEGSVPAAEQGLLAQCEELIKHNGILWLREGQRRKNYDASLKSFFADHGKLMQWCRQRLATLSGLTQPEHIQEFCASFRNSTAVMGSNLLVLLESSSALIPNKEVERALLDISETWLGLETFAYERLRTTLLEQHSKNGLEAEARAWPDYSKKLINSLTEAQRLLNETNDASSAKLLASLKDSCAQLIQDHDAHLLIVEHLADFSVREECLSDHYRALRAMIFSRITMLCQTFAGLTFPRRAEYSDCVAEASAWVESKTKSDAWQDMLERVEHIRMIIEKSDGTGAEN